MSEAGARAERARSIAVVVEFSASPAGAERLEARLLDRSLADLRRESLAALHLPAEGPLILTGHQAQTWHAGILAKWCAADAAARAFDGHAVQLLVDEDVNDPGLIEYPTLRDGRLAAARVPMARPPETGPVALRAPVRTGALEHPPLPEVAPGLERILEALRASADQPNAALQLAAANDRLLEGLVRPMPTLCGTTLMGTPIGAALLEAMRRDPARCIEAYNRALAADPHLAAPLDAASEELPLWVLTRGHPRARYHLADGRPEGSLAPRAFLLTAILRLALADLFIHGTGGRRYERITEAWIRDWLGLELAPIAVVTATLRLPLERCLGEEPITTPAQWRRAWWDPALAPESSGPSPGKREQLDRIAFATPRSAERRSAYRELITAIERERDRERPRLERLEAQLERSRARAAEAEVALRRTWPFPLHERGRLLALREEIGARVDGRRR